MDTSEGKVNGNVEKNSGDDKKAIWQIVLIVAVIVLAIAGIAALVWKLGNADKENETPASALEASNSDGKKETVTEEETTEEETTEEETTEEETTQEETTEEETTEEETTQEETTEEVTTEEPTREPVPLTQPNDPSEFWFEDTGDKKYAYLTFDDGPSDNTYAILDILDSYQVKATFFTNGREDSASLDRYRAITEKGHALGMHSYTHVYNEIYASLDAFKSDTERIHQLLYQVTGQDIRLYRFPGGSSNTITDVPIETFINYLTSEGYIYYDWNVSSGDATAQAITAENIANNVLEQAKGCTRAMILMHDGNKKGETVKALPAIIEGLKAQGFEIVPITESTRPIQHVKAIYMQ